MNFLEWMAVLGVLLLILALASAFLRWLPITTSLICLGFGVLIGQLGIGLWEMEFLHIAGWMEHLTEVAVLVSLFVSGLKLRMPLRHPAWKSAYVLAGPVMLACIGGVTLLCHYVFGLSWGVAVLIGAILAPTDPVLASLGAGQRCPRQRPPALRPVRRGGLQRRHRVSLRGVRSDAHRPGPAEGRLGRRVGAAPDAVGGTGGTADRLSAGQAGRPRGDLPARTPHRYRHVAQRFAGPGPGADRAGLRRRRAGRCLGLSRRVRRGPRPAPCGNGRRR